jgi:hypothetical protein
VAMRERRPRARSDDGIKGHALRAEDAGLVFQFGRHVKLAKAGAEESQDMVKEPAAEKCGFPHGAELVFILYETERLDQGSGNGREKTAAKFRGECGLPTLQVGDGGVSGVESGELLGGLRAGLRCELGGEPLDGGDSGVAGEDFDGGGLDFRPGLRDVAAIREHAGSAAGDGEGGGGAGKSAEIAEVGKMGDQQAGEPATRHFAAQCGDAAGVVHGGSFIMAGRGSSS